MRFPTAIALLVIVSASAAQGVYRWTDRAGKTHFTDTPPRSSAKKAVEVRQPAAPAKGNEVKPYALQLAQEKHPVRLYTASECAACTYARTLLNARGVPYTEVSVRSEREIAELKTLAGNASVPTLAVGKSVQQGFEEGAFNRALDAAGYPRKGVLPARQFAEGVAGASAGSAKKTAAPRTSSPFGPVPQR